MEKGVSVTLYDNPVFEGKGTTIRGPSKYCDIRHAYKGKFVRSIKVTPHLKTSGVWEPVMRSNQDIAISLTRTATKSNSKSVTHSEGKAITDSINSDFWFFTENVSSTVS